MYFTILNRVRLEVNASSKQEAIRKLNRRYGLAINYVELEEHTYKRDLEAQKASAYSLMELYKESK